MTKGSSIYAKLVSIVVVFVLGFSVHSVVFYNSTPEGYEESSYRGVMRMQDVLSDAEPDTLLLMEAPLLASELVHEPDAARRSALMEQWSALAQRVQQRMAQWSTQLPEGVLRSTVVQDARARIEQMLAIGDERLIPALRAGDDAGAQAAMADLFAAYHEHDSALQQLRARAQQDIEEGKVAAASGILWRKLSLFGIGLLIVTAGTARALWIGGRLVERLKMIGSTLESVASGDMQVRMPVAELDELGHMEMSLNRTIEAIERVLREIRGIAVLVADNAEGVAHSSDSLSNGAQQQAASLEQTAASLEEIVATIRQGANSAQQADQVAATSQHVAQRGGNIVTEAVGAMDRITDASRRISDIMTTIDEIALQTNLLALNAAVEAARAGEQGRGFAVVAGEVGNLAQRSAAAAKEVKTLIQDSLERIRTGHALVSESGKALSDIIVSASQVSRIVSDIASGMREQSTGVDEVNVAVSHMDQLTQAGAAQADGLAHTAGQLAESATQLKGLLLKFRLGGQPGMGVQAVPARPQAFARARTQADAPRLRRVGT